MATTELEINPMNSSENLAPGINHCRPRNITKSEISEDNNDDLDYQGVNSESML